MQHEHNDEGVIAEQHAVTFSAGLAAQGMLPVCNIYSSFMQRGYDSVIHDVATQGLKVIFCLDRAGIVGEDGATHHGVFDLAAFRPIPNLAIASCRNELELKNLLWSATQPEYPAIIIRYPRGNGVGTEWRNEKFSTIPLGKGEILSDGKEIALLTIGPIAEKGKAAVRMAREKGVSVLHYDVRFLKPLDEEKILEIISDKKLVVTAEDGALTGGLNTAICELVAKNGLNIRVKGIGIPDRFIEQGSVPELMEECGMTEEKIFEAFFEKN